MKNYPIEFLLLYDIIKALCKPQKMKTRLVNDWSNRMCCRGGSLVGWEYYWLCPWRAVGGLPTPSTTSKFPLTISKQCAATSDQHTSNTMLRILPSLEVLIAFRSTHRHGYESRKFRLSANISYFPWKLGFRDIWSGFHRKWPFLDVFQYNSTYFTPTSGNGARISEIVYYEMLPVVCH